MLRSVSFLTSFISALWKKPVGQQLHTAMVPLAPICQTMQKQAEVAIPEVTPIQAVALPTPVIFGVPRSGTTLTRLMLDSHPDLAIPPETGFLTQCENWAADESMTPETFVEMLSHFPPEAPGWGDFDVRREDLLEAVRALPAFHPIGGVRCFFQCYARRFGKKRWGEKTPDNLHHLIEIHRAFPEVRFLHVVRDPRDVVLSWRATWFAPSKDLAVLAAEWERRITIARLQMAQVPHALEIRYEDLVEQPEATLRRVCAFLELEFHPLMLEHHTRSPERLKEHRDRRRKDGTLIASHEVRLQQQRLTMQPPEKTRVAAWRNVMTPEERLAVEGAVGPLLQELGYGPRL